MDDPEIIHQVHTDENGWILYRQDDGSYSAEYYEVDILDQDDQNQDKITVYRFDIEDDIIKDLNWVNWAEIDGFIGYSIKKFATSDNVTARLNTYIDIGQYYGFLNLDSYPLELTREEFEERYFGNKELRELNDKLIVILNKITKELQELGWYFDQIFTAQKFPNTIYLLKYIEESIETESIGIVNVIEALSGASKEIYKNINQFGKQWVVINSLTALSKYLGQLKELSIKFKALGVN